MPYHVTSEITSYLKIKSPTLICPQQAFCVNTVKSKFLKESHDEFMFFADLDLSTVETWVHHVSRGPTGPMSAPNQSLMAILINLY